MTQAILFNDLIQRSMSTSSSPYQKHEPLLVVYFRARLPPLRLTRGLMGKYGDHSHYILSSLSRRYRPELRGQRLRRYHHQEPICRALVDHDTLAGIGRRLESCIICKL
jgi:hypothetical protein